MARTGNVSEKRFSSLFWWFAAFEVLVITAVVVLLIAGSLRPSKTADFYALVDEIQAAKEAYADVHGIPHDATLTEAQLEAVLTPFYADHPRNEQGNFVSPDPREYIEVPRQVNRRPGLVVLMYWLDQKKQEE